MKPLLNFNTESFSYRLYTSTEEENKMLDEFSNDEKTQEFLKDFKNYIIETDEELKLGVEPSRYTTIVYYEEEPIGLVTFYDLENELIFSHGIRPNKRGNKFSSRIKKELFDYVFRSLEEVEKITVYIDSNNTNNLHSLQKLTYDEIETIFDEKENKEYLKVSNYNPYLEKSNKNK